MALCTGVDNAAHRPGCAGEKALTRLSAFSIILLYSRLPIVRSVTMKLRLLALLMLASVSLAKADPVTVTLTGFVVVGPYPLTPPGFEFTDAGTIDFSGFGSASYSGTGMAFSPGGLSEFMPATGNLSIQFPDGSDLLAKSVFVAGALVPSLGVPPAVGELSFTGGTGEFAGVTGDVLLTAQSESQRGNRTTYTWTGAGSWSIPEPGAAPLLLGAFLIFGGAAWNRRRINRLASRSASRFRIESGRPIVRIVSSLVTALDSLERQPSRY